jgi:cell wall-associated NlpC family hydrolase
VSGRAGWAAAAIAGAAGFLILAFLLLVTVLAGAAIQSPAGQPALNTAAVPAQYARWVEKAGAECPAVSAPQIAAQLQEESSWHPLDVNHSSGAEGIAQFLPGTWPSWGRADAPGPVSPFSPPDAIMAMGRYDCAIAAQVASVPGDPVANMLAGYNAGPHAVLQAGGIPPFAQTQGYVAIIERLIPRYELSLAAGPAAGGAFARAEIAAAEHWLGTPYVWGGGGPSGPAGGGFDCSGLVIYAVYQASGHRIVLPHSSEIQATLGAAVRPADLQPGDVIAIQEDPGTNPGDYSHIVIYLGGGEVIQAPHTGANVDEIPLSDFSGLPQTIRRFG